MSTIPNWQTAIGVTAILAVFFFAQYLDSPADWEAERATAASLRDALVQAQKERPELWTAEQRARADFAAELAAKEVSHE